MKSMFQNAVAFNQPLDAWTIDKNHIQQYTLSTVEPRQAKTLYIIIHPPYQDILLSMLPSHHPCLVLVRYAKPMQRNSW